MNHTQPPLRPKANFDVETALGCVLPLALVAYFAALALHSVLALSVGQAWWVLYAASIAICLGFVALRNVTSKCEHGVACNLRGGHSCAACDRAFKQWQANEEQERQRCEAEKAEAERKLQEELARERRAETARLRELSYLMSLDPLKFEQLVQELFRRGGWEVAPTPASNDRGVDGFLRMQGRLVILQCKRLTTGAVGAPILRDLVGAVHAERAEGGIVVTTSKFTAEALRWKDQLPNPQLLVLVDGRMLVEMLRQYFTDDSPVPQDFVVPPIKSNSPKRRRRGRFRRHR